MLGSLRFHWALLLGHGPGVGSERLQHPAAVARPARSPGSADAAAASRKSRVIRAIGALRDHDGGACPHIHGMRRSPSVSACSNPPRAERKMSRDVRRAANATRLLLSRNGGMDSEAFQQGRRLGDEIPVVAGLRPKDRCFQGGRDRVALDFRHDARQRTQQGFDRAPMRTPPAATLPARRHPREPRRCHERRRPWRTPSRRGCQR